MVILSISLHLSSSGRQRVAVCTSLLKQRHYWFGRVHWQRRTHPTINVKKQLWWWWPKHPLCIQILLGISCLATACRTEQERFVLQQLPPNSSVIVHGANWHSACPKTAGTYFMHVGRKANERNLLTPSIAHHRISRPLRFKNICWNRQCLKLHLHEFSIS